MKWFFFNRLSRGSSRFILLLSDFGLESRFPQDGSHINDARDKQQHHRGDGEPFVCEKPFKRSQMKPAGVRLIRQTRSQAKVEIRRRFHRAQAADNLSQLCLLLVKLATLAAFPQMLSRAVTELSGEHQLFELATNCFTFCFLHNFLTYK